MFFVVIVVSVVLIVDCEFMFVLLLFWFLGDLVVLDVRVFVILVFGYCWVAARVLVVLVVEQQASTHVEARDRVRTRSFGLELITVY